MVGASMPGALLRRLGAIDSTLLALVSSVELM
jgi:hypothetical protein